MQGGRLFNPVSYSRRKSFLASGFTSWLCRSLNMHSSVSPTASTRVPTSSLSAHRLYIVIIYSDNLFLNSFLLNCVSFITVEKVFWDKGDRKSTL